ncbi:fasciclin domain-containing protein [Phormidium pseudopriestleyi FRX01]|uniref:Fasciclin domain-containing protein n=1 Tax=Phormidium pseudopriestleyi FRX01 TaxID=1759528 RepID=A0ABS3FYG9_9CYAN|nr:fasciclin domain-containing protein [Phormidium pseudopriestleyi]MBO0352165.1 fasciclin domain-containing protein [Phormidium pseudopriestleyi FRX01]
MADLIETASELGQFKTLMTLLESADLLDLLKSPGPYTIFAPTDEAFAALSSNTIANWMEDIPKLKKILTYHVLNGDVRTDNLDELASAETVEGSVVGVDTLEGIQINDAKVLSADRLTDNGVIHAIDKVLIPSLVSV